MPKKQYTYKVWIDGESVVVRSDKPLTPDQRERTARQMLTLARLGRGQITPEQAMQSLSNPTQRRQPAPARSQTREIPPMTPEQMPPNLRNQFTQLGGFLASNANTVFSGAKDWNEINKRIESYLPADLRQWYNQQDTRTQTAFRRGVIRLIEAEHARRAGGFGSAIWDAFVRPETMRPDYQRGGSITRQQHAAPKGTDMGAGQRDVGAIEAFGNILTTPLRALTSTILTATAQGKTFGRESGTPTQVSDWSSVYAADPSWGSVLEAWFPSLSPTARMIVGAGMNLFLDPANLVGVGAVGRTAGKLDDVGRASRAGSRITERTRRVVNEAVERPLIRRGSETGLIRIRTKEGDEIPLTDYFDRLKERAETAYNNDYERAVRGHRRRPQPTRYFYSLQQYADDLTDDTRLIIPKEAGNDQVVGSALGILQGVRRLIGKTEPMTKSDEDFIVNRLYKAVRSNNDSERAALIDAAARRALPNASEQVITDTSSVVDTITSRIPPLIAERKYQDPNLIERAVRAWKSTKTAYNVPAGAVRNFFQNFIYRWLTGDVSETDIVRGVLRSISDPSMTRDIVRALRGEVASDPTLASEAAKRLGTEEARTVWQRIDRYLRERFGDADLLAAAIMARGKRPPLLPVGDVVVQPTTRKSLDRLTRADADEIADAKDWLTAHYTDRARELVPDYTRVPTLIQDLARLGVLPFGHWMYYAATGTARGLATHPSRAAKLIDAFTAGESNRPDRDYQYTNIPMTDREVRTDIIAPFELGAGSEMPMWALEQVPLINLGLRLQRITQRREPIAKELTGFIAPPSLGYYAPNLLAESLQLSPESRQFWSQFTSVQPAEWQGRKPRETVDFLLGLFGLPTRPQDPANDLANYYDRIYRDAQAGR